MYYQLRITEYDLMRILTDYDNGLLSNPEAFERYEPGEDVFDDSACSWAHLYILGTEYTDVMVFRAYIEAMDHPCGVYMFTGDCRWVVASNFAITSIVEEYTR